MTPPADPVVLAAGVVAWADLSPARGREQDGHRPVLVVAGAAYLGTIDSLVLCVPVTSVERRWPNHVAVEGPTGLAVPSWAMTEQIRSVSRGRLTRVSGQVDCTTLIRVRRWIADFLELELPR